MRKIVKEIIVSTAPEIIWNMIVGHLKYPEVEVERDSEWKKMTIKDIKGVKLTKNRTGIGVKTRWYYKFYGFPYNWDDEVIEWEELKRVAWKSISTWNMIDSFTIIPKNKESQLIYEMEYEPPYGILGKIHFSLLVNKHIEKHLEYTLRRMKRTAEEIAKSKVHKK